ncbi:telomere repeat binding factor-domain-containing protein [Lasiosphaeria miniovina]|uniref:Telomere repeat binding factor-domain-containing protein n=1 Tax=Lasiosphaeria miniovina TaxID=1954250 RepID=A0AA40A084_9PEZI|nr:telomere repeat binding factor-domain-containing protein [Lasiosphaeria miniovina]KAK0706674.1 telomere repeat binding factor-domain-containing protein [Lasiosphaeria miniovina]
MDDANSSLEADLFAALAAADPRPETSSQNHTAKGIEPSQNQTAQLSDPAAQDAPPAAAQDHAAVAHGGLPTTQNYLSLTQDYLLGLQDLQPAPQDHALITQDAQDLATAQDTPAAYDTPVTQAPVYVPLPAPQEPARAPSPKRSRSPELPDESSAKRLKTEQIDGGGGHGTMSADLAAMLSDALASFDAHPQPGPANMDTDLNGAHETTEPPAPAPDSALAALDATSTEKVTRIMKVATNSTYVMRSMSLPVLGNVAVQILLRLSLQSRAEIESLLADPESEFRKAYDILKNMFGLARKMFSDYPLLFPDELDIGDSEDRETIRMSNLATAAAGLLVDMDLTLEEVHDSVLSIFIPEDGEYRENLTDFFVNLKTRVFLDATGAVDEAPNMPGLLDKLFPSNFDELLKQRSGDQILNGDEERLVDLVRSQRDLVFGAMDDESAKLFLESQFSSEKLAESLSIFLRDHVPIVVEYAERYGVNIPLSDEGAGASQISVENHDQIEHDNLAALIQSVSQDFTHEHVAEDMHTSTHHEQHDHDSTEDMENYNLRALLEHSLSSHGIEPISDSNNTGAHETTEGFDAKDLASLISEKLNDNLEACHGLPDVSALNYSTNDRENSHDINPQYLAQLNAANSSPYQPFAQSPAVPHVEATSDRLPPNQSSPTSVLYERARQAAVAKSSNTARREGLHSTRRPWTPEEEKALMAGLDTVKGPHWSQILSLFGQAGTISDILKDRTQVQLKDKARNLKLFFLKTNSEMPYYLQSVTGELKTRAPSQAARKEAEEKARMNLEDDQKRIQGIMTLAGGLHSNHRPVMSSPLAASSPNRGSPMSQALQGGSPSTGANSAQAPGTTASTFPHLQNSPLVKTEPAEHHSTQQVNKLPQIQPAPAPPQQTPIAFKPQPPIQQQPQKQLQPQHQHQQQHPTQLEHQRQQQQQQQRQQQQQLHQQQQYQQTPQQQQQQAQPHQNNSPPSFPTQPQSQAHNLGLPQASPDMGENHNQTYGLPPLPPNPHSTPDQVQDTKLFETLQAAIAASVNDNHVPVAAMSEASVN